MKTILFVAHSATLAGGGEKSLLDAVKETHKKKAYTIVVSVPEEGDFTEELKKLNIAYEICMQRFSISRPHLEKPSHWEAIANADALTGAKKIIEKIKPDLVIINTSVIPWFGYVAKIYNIPVITMVRELHGNRNDFNFLPDDEHYLRELSEYSDVIAYNSEFTRSSYSYHLPADKSFILYPVVSIPEVYVGKTKTAPILSHEDEKVSLIILGNVASHKNQLEVVKAIEILIRRHKISHIQLDIMGPVFKDDYINIIKQYIIEHDLSKYVNFLPFSNNPYPEILNHDILVMASPNEAFGRVTIESQLLERLTIGADSAGTLEIIKDKDSGLLYKTNSPSDLADKIAWAITHKDEAKKIALSGRKSAIAKYSATQIYKPFFSHISHLLSKKHTPPPVQSKYYYPLYALIERNQYMDTKLNEYARALEGAIEENTRKQAIIDKGVRARTKKVIKKIIKR